MECYGGAPLVGWSQRRQMVYRGTDDGSTATSPLLSQRGRSSRVEINTNRVEAGAKESAFERGRNLFRRDWFPCFATRSPLQTAVLGFARWQALLIKPYTALSPASIRLRRWLALQTNQKTTATTWLQCQRSRTKRSVSYAVVYLPL